MDRKEFVLDASLFSNWPTARTAGESWTLLQLSEDVFDQIQPTHLDRGGPRVCRSLKVACITPEP